MIKIVLTFGKREWVNNKFSLFIHFSFIIQVKLINLKKYILNIFKGLIMAPNECYLDV